VAQDLDAPISVVQVDVQHHDVRKAGFDDLEGARGRIPSGSRGNTRYAIARKIDSHQLGTFTMDQTGVTVRLELNAKQPGHATNFRHIRISFHFQGESPMTSVFNRLIALVFAALLASLLGCASTSTREGAGEYVDDTAITAKVKAAVFEESSLKSAEINVETFKGTVQLSGFVSSAANISKAVELARGVPGVKSVKNDMRVK
jgi:hypothetical protein